MCRSETERMQMAWRSSSPCCSPPRPNRISSSGSRPFQSVHVGATAAIGSAFDALARHELQPAAVISGRNHLQGRLLTPLAGHHRKNRSGLVRGLIQISDRPPGPRRRVGIFICTAMATAHRSPVRVSQRRGPVEAIWSRSRLALGPTGADRGSPCGHHRGASWSAHPVGLLSPESHPTEQSRVACRAVHQLGGCDDLRPASRRRSPVAGVEPLQFGRHRRVRPR